MQSVSSKFHELAQGGVRPHKWELLMSFDKEFDDSIEYFILDYSLLGGADILKPVDDNPIQYWDYYSYTSYRDRLNSLAWSSSLDFPHSLQASRADIILNNYDNYFTPNTNSPIASYILPGRPTKILAGYGEEAMVQQFVGVTKDKPVLDPNTKTASFRAAGFMSEIASLRLAHTVSLANVRTDEALATIFEQFGISSNSYVLDRGRNIIPFLFLENDNTVGEALYKIMEAEGGKLYIDEQGVIRFVQRLGTPSDPVFGFNQSNVAAAKHSDETQIINRVVVTSNIREVQDFQPIFFGSGTNGNATITTKLLIPAGESAQYEISLEDPLADYNLPTLGRLELNSWFTAQTKTGTNVTSNLSITDSSLTTEKLVLIFTNIDTQDLYLDSLVVWGEPAKVIDTIIYEAYDQASIDQHGEYLYETTNDLFGNEGNCESFAYTILDAYSTPGTIIDMTIKGDYAIQLGDIVSVDLLDTEGIFQVINISTIVSGNGVEETIRVKRYNPRQWFMLDISSLDAGDIIAP